MTIEQRTPAGAGPASAGLPAEPAPADDDPAGPESAVPPADIEQVVIPRWLQAVALAAVLLGVSALGRASRPVLLLFVVAGVIALILNPLVKVLQRVGLPRGVSIGAVLLGFAGALAGAVALLVNPVTRQIQAFQQDLPGLIDNANASLGDLQQSLDRRGLGIQIAARGETALETLRSNVVEGSGDVLSFARELVTVLVEAGFAVILILVIAIYMLLYGTQIGGLVRRVMPPGDGTPDDDYPIRVQKAVFGYVRGQLTFSLVMGLSAGVSLWVFGALGIFPAGQTYAVFFGVFYGVMELVPYVGPVIGAAPAILVALFQGEPLTALWLALLFLVLQQIEGHIVAPQIFSHSLRINPLVVILVLLLGGHLEGIVGALVALPLAAIVRETVLYLRRHMLLEPWGTPSAAALLKGSQEAQGEHGVTGGAPGAPEPTGTSVGPGATGASGGPAATGATAASGATASTGTPAAARPPRRRCPECGTSTLPSAEFCFACGTPVRPQFRQPDTDRAGRRAGSRRLEGARAGPRTVRLRGLGWPLRRRGGPPGTPSAEREPARASAAPGPDTTA